MLCIHPTAGLSSPPPPTKSLVVVEDIVVSPPPVVVVGQKQQQRQKRKQLRIKISTVGVAESGSSSSSPGISRRGKRRRRRVRFADSFDSGNDPTDPSSSLGRQGLATYIDDDGIMSKAERKQELWYSWEDYRRFKMTVKVSLMLLKDLFESGDKTKDTKTDAALYAIDNAYPMGYALLGAMNRRDQDKRDQYDYQYYSSTLRGSMIAWTCLDDNSDDNLCYRGLEHHVSSRHWDARQRIISKSKSAVFVASSASSMKISTTTSTSTSPATYPTTTITKEEDDLINRIASSYMTENRVAGIMARYVGQADEVTVAKIYLADSPEYNYDPDQFEDVFINTKNNNTNKDTTMTNTDHQHHDENDIMDMSCSSSYSSTSSEDED